MMNLCFKMTSPIGVRKLVHQIFLKTSSSLNFRNIFHLPLLSFDFYSGTSASTLLGTDQENFQ